MSRLLSRCGLLWTGAGVAGALALAGLGSALACSRLGPAAGSARARLAQTLPEVFAPARLAAAQPGPQGGAAALLRRIGRQLGLRAALAADCPAARRALVRQQIAADFAAGAVVVVDRLVVSRSECLIAACCLGPQAPRPTRSTA